VGRWVAAATGLPWIADLRDPLVSDFDRTASAEAHRVRRRRAERRIVRKASVIVTTCEALAADLRGRYPDRAARIRCVFNGFDRADILPVAESNTTAS